MGTIISCVCVVVVVVVAVTNVIITIIYQCKNGKQNIQKLLSTYFRSMHIIMIMFFFKCIIHVQF